MARSTIYEVDEDVYQITTEHDDGRVTVETVFGRDAYEQHAEAALKEGIHNDGREHTRADARTSQGRIAGTSNYTGMWH